METVYVLQHIEDKSFYGRTKTFGYSLAFAKMYNYKIWAQNDLNRMDSRLSNKLIISNLISIYIQNTSKTLWGVFFYYIMS